MEYERKCHTKLFLLKTLPEAREENWPGEKEEKKKE